MEPELVHNPDGKVFPRKFEKLGDICLTEKDERIFVCSLCKCLSVTLAQFWKHQRDNHKIRDYQDILDKSETQNTNNNTLPASNQQDDEGNSFPIQIKTRSSNRLQNGSATNSERNAAKRDDTTRGMKRKPLKGAEPQIDDVDSPLLKRALKGVKTKPTADQLTPPATQEQLCEEALDSNSNDNNFNKFIIFSCPECGKRFETNQLWRQHIADAHNFFANDKLNISLYKRNSDGSTIYKCDICNVLLNKPNFAPLRRHKLTHMPHKSFCCRLCSAKIRHKSGIVHHMRVVHRKGQQKLYNCGECKKSFYSEVQYKKHFRMNPHERNPWSEWEKTEGSEYFLPDVNSSAVDESFGFLNEITEDCNYDKADVSVDDDYDASAFLVTEMTEEEGDQDLFAQSYDTNIKEEPPVEIIDVHEGNVNTFESDVDTFEDNVNTLGDTIGTPDQPEHLCNTSDDLMINAAADSSQDCIDAYSTLWQEDAALIAEQKMQREAYERIQASRSWEKPHPPGLECLICSQIFTSEEVLNKHLRTHGKEIYCRHCGAELLSMKALRQHIDLKRCKVLAGQTTANNNPKLSSDQPATKVNRKLRSTKEILGITKRSDDKAKEQVLGAAKPKDGRRPQLAIDTSGGFKCEDCTDVHETEVLLSLHAARAHGKTECRLCNVKISSLRALRRHYDSNRCKALK